MIFSLLTTITRATILVCSEIVKEAKAKGYTEPDPRDDLNGTDVARKVRCSKWAVKRGPLKGDDAIQLFLLVLCTISMG